MKSKGPVFCFAAWLVFAAPVFAEDDAGARAIFDKMLAAQDAKQYESFLADANDQLKDTLTRANFEQSSDILRADAAGGPREITFLGELNQSGYEIYLYRLRFKTGDLLGTLTLDKDGKVAGIWFK
jgi:hypothetical protein